MGKTQCQYRLEGVTDHGVILRPSQKGEPLYPCEGGGIRDPQPGGALFLPVL